MVAFFSNSDTTRQLSSNHVWPTFRDFKFDKATSHLPHAASSYHFLPARIAFKTVASGCDACRVITMSQFLSIMGWAFLPTVRSNKILPWRSHDANILSW